jgi:hypothetical protein
MAIPFTQLWFSATYSQLMKSSLYAVITLDTAALDKANKVAVLVTDATAKRSPTVYPLCKSDKFPISKYFHTNRY